MNQSNNMTASSAPVLMTIQEACTALQISRWQLYKLINQTTAQHGQDRAATFHRPRRLTSFC